MRSKLFLAMGVALLAGGLVVAAFQIPVGPGSGPTGLVVKEPAPTPAGMVWVKGGKFVMGTDDVPDHNDSNPNRIKLDEFPAHHVELDGFWMDEAPVTNAQFKEFVDMTGYVTFAERQLTKQDFADRGVDTTGLPDTVINAGSMCFNPAFNRKQLVKGIPGWEHQVWEIIDGANWKHPDGPESSIDDRMDHPVVHIAFEDAVAYCEWAGKRLPTEAEFEYAARSGGKDVMYPWGNEFLPGGVHQCNAWQGEFPVERKNEDGFVTTSPVKSYKPNDLGLYDIAGNVWEWCSDLYHESYYAFSPRRNPQGPSESYDSLQPGVVKHVQRGGSFLCNVNNCTGYRTRARMRGDMAGSSFHNGFRCVVDSKMTDAYRTAREKYNAWKSQAAGVPEDAPRS